MFDSIESFPFITDGIVKATDDPIQNGRIKIWCPVLDGENFDVETLPWAEYASPFAGITNDFSTGRNSTPVEGPMGYGFWALPKIGAQVLVFLLNGNPSRRFYFASFFGLQRNRSLPAGRNNNDVQATGPFTDSLDPLQPAYDNLRTAFQGKIDSPQAKTRGVFERQVAQDRTEKNGKDGYAKNPVDGQYLDPQTYCFVTPGRHTFLMSDAADNCRIRFKSCEGNQIIIDDTNERIYISTAKGKTWIELDEDGHVHLFGSESVSLRAGKDFNIFADGNINLEAGQNVNMKSTKGTTKITADQQIHIKSASSSINMTACSEFHICTTNGYFVSAGEINTTSESSIVNTARGGSIDFNGSTAVNLGSGSNSLNLSNGAMKVKTSSFELDAGENMTFGAKNIQTYSNGGGGGSYSPFSTANMPSESSEATCAEDADGPSVVPGHEPWKRPKSAKKRNKNWSE